MCNLENRALTNYLGILPTVYKRYVDDCFLIFGSAQQSQVFFNYLNNQHQNIKFTMEEEQNNILPFLDIKITRKDDAILSTSVFHKSTYSGLYLQWSSFVPKQYKLGLCLLYRAWKICSDVNKDNNICFGCLDLDIGMSFSDDHVDDTSVGNISMQHAAAESASRFLK